MPVVLVIVGAISCLVGTLLIFAGLPAGGSLLTLVIASAPGLAAIVNGLLIIGAALGLEDLGRIAKAAEKTAALLQEQAGPER